MLYSVCLTFYSSYFQKYTAKKMYELSEAFFMTLGFDKMTDTFWEKSMIEKPEDKDVVCHASAEDFYRQEDFR
jgi:peptidyl-dipeptidase A